MNALQAWQLQEPDTYWKEDDTTPAIVGTFRDGAGNLVNLTGATLRFEAWFPSGSALKIDQPAAPVGPPTNGVASYDPVAADTDTPGDLMAQFKATFSGGTEIERFPNGGWLKIRVLRSGPAP